MIPKLITRPVSEYTFEEKVKSMTASEIIMAMVEALTHPPIIDIDMATYGEVRSRTKTYFFGLFKGKTEEVCFGCAATNTICQIAGKKFTPDSVSSTTSRANYLGVRWYFMRHFEYAINYLRQGDLHSYNKEAEEYGFAIIKDNDKIRNNLDYLGNMYTNENLKSYTALANFNKAIELAE